MYFELYFELFVLITWITAVLIIYEVNKDNEKINYDHPVQTMKYLFKSLLEKFCDILLLLGIISFFVTLNTKISNALFLIALCLYVFVDPLLYLIQAKYEANKRKKIKDENRRDNYEKTSI